MPDRFSRSFFCLVLAFLAALPASAEESPQAIRPEATESSQQAQEAKPEEPKSLLSVELQNDLLSVELKDVDFGSAIRAIADKAGFAIEGAGEVLSRKLNTRFTGVEVERGVLRLLSLVRENNYMLQYDAKGRISKLELLPSGAEVSSRVNAGQPSKPAPQVRRPESTPYPLQTERPAVVYPAPQTQPLQPALRRRPVRSRPVPASQSAATQRIVTPPPVLQPSEPMQTEEAPEGSENEEETVSEIPYIAPQPRFAPAGRQ